MYLISIRRNTMTVSLHFLEGALPTPETVLILAFVRMIYSSTLSLNPFFGFCTSVFVGGGGGSGCGTAPSGFTSAFGGAGVGSGSGLGLFLAFGNCAFPGGGAAGSGSLDWGTGWWWSEWTADEESVVVSCWRKVRRRRGRRVGWKALKSFSHMPSCLMAALVGCCFSIEWETWDRDWKNKERLYYGGDRRLFLLWLC